MLFEVSAFGEGRLIANLPLFTPEQSLPAQPHKSPFAARFDRLAWRPPSGALAFTSFDPF
jgi:hypothetical protein